MPLYDYRCTSCDLVSEGMATYEQRDLYLCECGAFMQRIFLKPPAHRQLGAEGTDKNIAAMKRSFNTKFVNGGEMDEVRHKHGNTFDESLVSAAVDRIKDNRA